jgi:hypothetical protein
MLRKYNILSHKGGDDDDGREEYGDDFDGGGVCRYAFIAFYELFRNVYDM